MTPAEALVAGTHGGARALDRPEGGTLREGTPADMAIIDAPSYIYVPYNFGVNTIETVFKHGEPVHGGADE
ncbi:MAG TPA: imidazolonepropionase, partial [Halococcus sp.]|nr:imidazolonepropionase [Halococcus sp.]